MRPTSIWCTNDFGCPNEDGSEALFLIAGHVESEDKAAAHIKLHFRAFDECGKADVKFTPCECGDCRPDFDVTLTPARKVLF